MLTLNLLFKHGAKLHEVNISFECIGFSFGLIGTEPIYFKPFLDNFLIETCGAYEKQLTIKAENIKMVLIAFILFLL